MSHKLLTKGIEIELFAGKDDGHVMPISKELTAALNYITQEPDQRNFEYITNPTISYEELRRAIIIPRIEIRKKLKEKWGLRLIPGSTIPLKYDKNFMFSKENDPYHKYIAKTYGTRAITTSIHINFGISDVDLLMKVVSSLRLDCHLFLALSASSCFYDGNLTDYKSYRWHSFPKSPQIVPFFRDKNEFVEWTKEKLSAKEMYNVRHLWLEIRPNGPKRPTELNRVEVRICDLICDVENTLAIVAFIELMIQSYIIDAKWPSAIKSNDVFKNETIDLVNAQQEEVAKNGLDANVYDWRTDSQRKVTDTISALLVENEGIAKNLNIQNYLLPIRNIIEEGNESEKFMRHYQQSGSVQTTIQHFMQIFEESDLETYGKINNKTMA